MMKMMRYLPLLLLVVFVGCNIITGNKLIVIELGDQSISGTSSGFEKWRVSKDEHGAWKDNAEDIKHVVDLGFAVQIKNDTNVVATAKFYVSEDSTLSNVNAVESEATLVLSDISVAANSTKTITWQESYDYLENFDTLKELVLKGKFWLYATAVGSPVDVTFHNTAVILTINVKP
jgi:hypothetical protein